VPSCHGQLCRALRADNGAVIRGLRGVSAETPRAGGRAYYPARSGVGGHDRPVPPAAFLSLVYSVSPGDDVLGGLWTIVATLPFPGEL